MFAYCRNNPVKRIDITGTADISYTMGDDTPFDDLIPDSMGASGGYTYGVSFATATYSSLYTGGIYNLGYSSYGFYSNPTGGSSTGASGGLLRQTDFYVTPNGEVIPATLDSFNSNLLRLENRNGKYIGSDSYGPIRLRVNEMHPANPNHTGVLSPYHTVPHFHIDRRMNGSTGDWVPTYTGAMEMFR